MVGKVEFEDVKDLDQSLESLFDLEAESAFPMTADDDWSASDCVSEFDSTFSDSFLDIDVKERMKMEPKNCDIWTSNRNLLASNTNMAKPNLMQFNDGLSDAASFDYSKRIRNNSRINISRWITNLMNEALVNVDNTTKDIGYLPLGKCSQPFEPYTSDASISNFIDAELNEESNCQESRPIDSTDENPSVESLPIAVDTVQSHDDKQPAVRKGEKRRLALQEFDNRQLASEQARGSAKNSAKRQKQTQDKIIPNSGGAEAVSGKIRTVSKPLKRCEFCLKVFDTPEAAHRHRQDHILDTNHFVCTFEGCTKRYATGEGLRLHARNVHLLAKNWKCMSQGCKRRFVRQSDLRMHIIRMHSNIRPYPCLVKTCSKSFACHSELRRHVLSCHKMPCPKPEKLLMRTNCIDKSYIEGLMLKAGE